MFEELLVGMLGMLLLYWLGLFLYPEPSKLLVNYAEAVGQVYGDESE